MRKKLVLLISFLAVFITAFSSIDFEYVLEEIDLGKDREITFLTDQDLVYIDVDFGGFEDPDIIFDGIKVIEGKGKFVYLSPFFETQVIFSFYDKNDNLLRELVINVVDKSRIQNIISLEIETLSGNVLHKSSQTDVWNNLNRNNSIKEEDEIYVAANSFLKLLGPQEIEIEITEDSQLIFERLRQEKEEIDVRYLIKKGTTYNSISTQLLPGSKFIVNDKNSVAAGVRGTRFSFETAEDSIIRVYKGEVIANLKESSFIVKENSMANFNIRENSFFVTPVDWPENIFLQNIRKPLDEKEETTSETVETQPDKEEPKEELKEEPKEELKEEPKEEPKEEERIQEATRIVETESEIDTDFDNLEFGSVKKDNVDYFVYSFAPEFKIGGLRLGLGFSAYQTELGGELYYGIPDEEPSINLINAFTLYRLGYYGKSFFFDYGRSGFYSFGMGNLVNRYYVPQAQVFDVGIKIGSFELAVHLPYELKKIYPISFMKSSSLHIVDLKYNFRVFEIELAYLREFLDEGKKAPFENAFILTMYRRIFGLKMGFEGDLIFKQGFEFEEDNYGYGGFIGAFYDLPPYLQFLAGLTYSSENYLPAFIDNKYHSFKNTYDGGNYFPEDSLGIGIRGRMDFALSDFLTLQIKYDRFFMQEFDILEGNLSFNFKNIYENLPNLTAGGYYYNKNVESIFDQNTFFELFVFYPLVGGNGFKAVYAYDSEKDEITYSLLFQKLF